MSAAEVKKEEPKTPVAVKPSGPSAGPSPSGSRGGGRGGAGGPMRGGRGGFQRGGHQGGHPYQRGGGRGGGPQRGRAKKTTYFRIRNCCKIFTLKNSRNRNGFAQRCRGTVAISRLFSISKERFISSGA